MLPPRPDCRLPMIVMCDMSPAAHAIRWYCPRELCLTANKRQVDGVSGGIRPIRECGRAILPGRAALRHLLEPVGIVLLRCGAGVGPDIRCAMAAPQAGDELRRDAD